MYTFPIKVIKDNIIVNALKNKVYTLNIKLDTVRCKQRKL
jgi:hypothetical protein